MERCGREDLDLGSMEKELEMVGLRERREVGSTVQVLAEEEEVSWAAAILGRRRRKVDEGEEERKALQEWQAGEPARMYTLKLTPHSGP